MSLDGLCDEGQHCVACSPLSLLYSAYKLGNLGMYSDADIVGLLESKHTGRLDNTALFVIRKVLPLLYERFAASDSPLALLKFFVGIGVG